MDEERINDLEVGEEIVLVDSFGNIMGNGTVERIRGRNCISLIPTLTISE